MNSIIILTIFTTTWHTPISFLRLEGAQLTVCVFLGTLLSPLDLATLRSLIRDPVFRHLQVLS